MYTIEYIKKELDAILQRNGAHTIYSGQIRRTRMSSYYI